MSSALQECAGALGKGEEGEVMQSEEALRAEAGACFTNAQQLYEEAKLLFEHDRLARAAALAVIGAEEFGKAIVYTVAALLPDQRHILPARLDGHELKHRVCDSAGGAQMVNKDLWDVTDWPSTPTMRLTDMFTSLARWGLAELLDQKEAKQHFKERRLKHAEDLRQWSHLQADPDKDPFLALREPDLKNAALYVDLDETGKVLSPQSRVDARSAKMSILSLEWFLEEYYLLPSVVCDDEAWHGFAEDVRQKAV